MAMATARWTLGASLILALALCATLRAQEVAPAVVWAELPAAIGAQGPGVRAGYLVVPERRWPAPSARTVRLPFVILPSRNASPRPDPVLFTAGGPGGSTLAGLKGWRNSPLLEDREVILLEQRGTRYALPALEAPGVQEALRSGWGARLNGEPAPRVLTRAMASAVAGFRAQGVDLAGYTTKESAADIAELRRLLAIPAWNLYGASYSTKVMLLVLRDHPEGVRSVVLDSVLPPGVHWDEAAPANILAVLDQVLAAWAGEPLLEARYPNLKARWFHLLGKANRRPLTLAIRSPFNQAPLSLKLDGAGLMNCVYAGLESVSTRRQLPKVLWEACRGNTQALAPLAEAYLGSSLGSAQGMRYAVWCNEAFPFERRERILHPAGLGRQLRRFTQTAIPVEALRAWPQGQPSPAEDAPVQSAVPVLIASGEFDPDTPVPWAELTARHLPNAQVLVFGGMSHVPLFSHPEAARLMRDFLGDPLRKVDPGTIRVRPPFS